MSRLLARPGAGLAIIDPMCHPFRRIDMHKILLIVSLTTLLLCGCVVTPADRVVVAPALPGYVELEVGYPYYHQHGYYYYYDNN